MQHKEQTVWAETSSLEFVSRNELSVFINRTELKKIRAFLKDLQHSFIDQWCIQGNRLEYLKWDEQKQVSLCYS